MISGSLSRRYAKALFAIAVDRNELKEIGDQLAHIASLVNSHDELRQALENTGYPTSQRRSVVNSVAEKLNLSAIMRNFLRMLIERNRASILCSVALEYRKFADQHLGQIRATVSTATEASKDFLAELSQTLERKLGKRVILSTVTDEQLIAGTVTTIGSLVYDGSLATRLKSLRNEFISHRL